MRRWMQFSKKVIIAMILLWFAGALFGMFMVYRTSMELSSLLNYISTPMSVGILGYLLKAAFENKEKIKQSGTTTATQTEVYSTPQPDPAYNERFPE